MRSWSKSSGTRPNRIGTAANRCGSTPRVVRAVASAVLLRGRFGDRRFYPSTAEVFGLIALGRYTIFRDRAKAVRSADAFREAVGALWDRGFVVVMPVSVFPAPRHHRSILNWKLMWCTAPGNIVDATSLAIPCGRFPDGMPRALQIMGPPGSEDRVLDIGERIVAAQGPTST